MAAEPNPLVILPRNKAHARMSIDGRSASSDRVSAAALAKNQKPDPDPHSYETGPIAPSEFVTATLCIASMLMPLP
jgi:hypothetical protein